MTNGNYKVAATTKPQASLTVHRAHKKLLASSFVMHSTPSSSCHDRAGRSVVVGRRLEISIWSCAEQTQTWMSKTIEGKNNKTYIYMYIPIEITQRIQ
jgi:hypothetical protein